MTDSPRAPSAADAVVASHFDAALLRQDGREYVRTDSGFWGLVDETKPAGVAVVTNMDTLTRLETIWRLHRLRETLSELRGSTK